MSADAPFTKENLDACLKELGKEFRKRNGTAMSAEIILIGGASVLANYGFRDVTYDIDAVIIASSAMKEAANHVSDKMGLPNGWLNMDFKRTKSYSDKLAEVSVYYKTFSNILTVRTITAEYLIAMKLRSGRRYKYDLSDIVGILWEHEKTGAPILRETIDIAVEVLYGDWTEIPPVSIELIDTAFESGDYEKLFYCSRESERMSKEILIEFDRDYPNALNEDSIDAIIERAKRNRVDKDAT